MIPTENDLFQPENDTVLDNNEAMSCEGHLTEQECLKALRSMDREKTPGTDGLPAEFYKIFWKDLSPLLISALNCSYDEGSLSITQRRGIIKLVPKKDAEPHLIKNWRPLTLLNCDYKIAAKAIANRIKSVIPKLINNDQTGFLKGRFIGENIRLIDNIMNYVSQKNIPGLLLFIDFEKAFDSLEWSFIERTLQYFGFGSFLISWFQTFYKNIESCVLNNGWASCFFQLQRGVRQDCPLSPYLFILSAEILAKAVRSNKNIKGISVNNSEIKEIADDIADDTTFILNGTSESLSATLQTIETFGSISALRHHYNTNFLVKNLVAQTLPIPSPRLLLRTIKRTELYTRSSSLSKVPFLLKAKGNGMIALDLMKDFLLTGLVPIVWQLGAPKAQNS